MEDLLAAFAIFFIYTDAARPTHCEYGELIVNVSPMT